MLSLIKEKDDIIFISDTRLDTEIKKSALNGLEKKLLFGGYDCFLTLKLLTEALVYSLKIN